MLNTINDFFSEIQRNPIEFYNESGLQHELALFLKMNNKNLTVRLEYPTSRVFNSLPQLKKKKIDIYVKTETEKQYIIELKMPKDNGGIPQAMYRTIEDVEFLEKLKIAGIDGCFSILATPCVAFWSAERANSGIYKLFNGQHVSIRSIDKPQLPQFLHKNKPIQLAKIYQSNWIDYTDIFNIHWKYYILDI